MSVRRYMVAALAALGFAFAVVPGNAISVSRETTFLFTCDGTNKTININATGFPIGSTQLVAAAEITLFENRGGLQYIILRAQGDPNKQLLSLGSADTRAQIVYSGFVFIPPGTNTNALISTTANAAGNVPLTIDGACNGGFGQVQGTVTVWFAS